MSEQQVCEEVSQQLRLQKHDQRYDGLDGNRLPNNSGCTKLRQESHYASIDNRTGTGAQCQRLETGLLKDALPYLDT